MRPNFQFIFSSISSFKDIKCLLFPSGCFPYFFFFFAFKHKTFLFSIFYSKLTSSLRFPSSSFEHFHSIFVAFLACIFSPFAILYKSYGFFLLYAQKGFTNNHHCIFIHSLVYYFNSFIVFKRNNILRFERK